MKHDPAVLIITPPFTQINTPYPASAYLKGFLNQKHIQSVQADLGLEVILKIYSVSGLNALFALIDSLNSTLSENCRSIVVRKQYYLDTIEPVIRFLQNKDDSIAHLICKGGWLPEAGRFAQKDWIQDAFGTMGIRDKARHLATLYLEDLSDLISQTIDPDFGFSRYAERLGRSPASFNQLAEKLDGPETFTDGIMLDLLRNKTEGFSPDAVALTVPFPGNLYSALRCGKWMKQNHSDITVVMGGGYVSTELRSLSDHRVFQYVDHIILDDGEVPLLNFLEYLKGKRALSSLKRTFALVGGQIQYLNGSADKDCNPADSGTPDYTGLSLNDYLSVIELVNPMHRLWSDGRWNRLTLAHGCYWGKCTFCDTTLDYIRRYEANTASDVCNRMEALIRQNNYSGFHFVDEAAPPALLRELSLEILRRGMNVSWWTNIRFEKNFTIDLCRLMSSAGCIAVAGGLEVASDRILKLINKGVSVTHAAQVAAHFSKAGILVHTYLMYGFPSQTARETIDSVEVVRQLFKHGLVQSGFWHLFTMTAHSLVGQNPANFGAVVLTKEKAPFANNDVEHADPSGCDHEKFGEGLRKALYNYMHGICFDFPLQEWFDFDIPQTTISPKFIETTLQSDQPKETSADAKVIWLGGPCSMYEYTRTKKGKTIPMCSLTLHNKAREVTIALNDAQGKWLSKLIPEISARNRNTMTFETLKQDFLRNVPADFNLFWTGTAIKTLRENGLTLL